MKLFPILTAILVIGSLYMLVFERQALLAFAAGEPVSQSGADEAAEDADASSAVRVVAVSSKAAPIEQAVLVRGRTEAARQVDVKAETSGQVVSDPLRKGAFVTTGDILCELDPGTRQVSLADAEARLAEARSRVPEAQARLEEARAQVPAAEAGVIEAKSRLREAEINNNAATSLSADGFASQSRVAATEAAVESARAAVQTANSRLESAKAGVASAKAGVENAQAGIQSAEAAVASAEKEIERLTIRAPFDGLLESDAAELGALLQPGMSCATVIQLSPIKLVGFVPETEVDRVELDAQAGARLASGSDVLGKVTFLSRSADPQTRTFRVEVTVPNDDLSIRDGQTVEILIRTEGQDAHIVPQSALTLDDNGTLGIRAVEDTNHVVFLPVGVLRDATDGIYVSGLPASVDVIVVGQEYVSEGVAVNPTYREASE
ncbi:efflux RND transporter periplasmic adaptor subunit [Anianabacter salinae]|uniref:efflux RND transporter periplasmic adaptor subunit n=1 Tax=Anianabacter salinae TaxID=2851023 RepID=UPI00225E6CFA|nr:efflux RND transporter periplasmic adaptor subunit [Anianabacter salinae]MBV0912883.1 efflux RND transporter periplasmic adaptor subunit [Anianabacter salinae]